MKNIKIGNIQIGKIKRQGDLATYPIYSLDKWSIKFCYEDFEYGIFRMYTQEEVDVIADALFATSDAEDFDLGELLAHILDKKKASRERPRIIHELQ